MRIHEQVYNDSDNYIPLRLTDGGAPISGGIGSLTRAVLTMKDVAGVLSDVTVDSQTSPSAFDWTAEGADSVIRIALGKESIPPATYICRLDTYDGGNTRIVWTAPEGPVELTVEVVAAP